MNCTGVAMTNRRYPSRPAMPSTSAHPRKSKPSIRTMIGMLRAREKISRMSWRRCSRSLSAISVSSVSASRTS